MLLKEYNVYNLNDNEKIADFIVQLFQNYNVFLFEGEIGSGKTTLINKICNKIGIYDSCSPTFSIINKYKKFKNKDVFHIDCYRIEEDKEIENIGLLEILDNDSICFIEWPKKIHNFLPNNCVKVKIDLQNNFRKISIKV